MSAVHERAAERLAALSSAEREWILARLAPPDAQAIRALMAAPPRESEPSGASPLERAPAADVAKALRGEPDWLLALVLARRRWPWDRELLAGLDAARLEALGELTRDAGERARPKACEAAVQALAARLEALAPRPAASSPFEDLLAAAQRNGG